MKVIDLLNKIANGDIPKKIKFGKGQFHWNKEIRNYEDDNLKYAYINWDIVATSKLNDEVEIIEEDKKIEKIDVNHLQTVKKCNRAKILGKKINEIIDHINKEK